MFQLFDVTHQVGLVPVFLKDRFSQVFRGTLQALGHMALLVDLFQRREFPAGCLGEDRQHFVRLVEIGHLVETDADAIVVDIEKVNLLCQCQRTDFACISLHFDRIENTPGRQFIAQFLQSFSYRDGMCMRIQRNAADTLGAVIHGKESGHRRQQRLCRTDIRRRTFALDVLLAHLERHSQRLVAETVHRHADDAARHITFVGVFGRQITGLRTAETHRDPETLRRTDHDIRAPLARRLEQREAQDVCRHGYQCAAAVSGGGKVLVIAHLAVSRRILHDRAELAARKVVIVEPVADDFDPERFAACEQQVERLRENILVDEQHVASLLDRLTGTERKHHQHRLRGSRRFVQQRAVTHLHTGQADHRSLEIEQRFETALRNLGLIRSVRGVPRRVLEHVAQDYSRRSRAVIPHTDQAAVDFILAADLTDVVCKFILAHAFSRQIERFFETDRRRNDLRNQLFDTFHSDHPEHLREFLLSHADMALNKFIL